MLPLVALICVALLLAHLWLPQAINIQPQTTLHPYLNLSSVDTTNVPNSDAMASNSTSLGDSFVSCNTRRTYGDLEYPSCRNALRKIPFFGEEGGPDVELRSRYRVPPPQPANLMYVASSLVIQSDALRFVSFIYFNLWNPLIRSGAEFM